MNLSELQTELFKATFSDFINRIKASENSIAIRVKIADLLSNLADSPTRNQIRKYSQALLELTTH